VGFLPGMQDEMQGIGGTQYMDWWFTKHAVILDTAGKYVIQGEGWEDFLKLLKKYRPNCPVNGLILAIPASDLFQDSTQETAAKAKQIADQIMMIQKVLEISFPLFVVVTKCDLLPGFREFFDGLEDPQLRHQIFGWSNRTSLDTPFDPNWVEQNIAGVVEQLNRRRLGLLGDELSASDEANRAEVMSQLFELPHNFSMLAAPLRVYVEKVFSGNMFNCKPPFFRGIYFTTSMQEGSPVDTAIWVRESGKPSAQAQTGSDAGGMVRRDKAYFLRDLFLKKIFVEKGLVTTATNTLRRRRNWRIATFACGAVALLLFLGVAMAGRRALSESVTDRSESWDAVLTDWKPNEWGKKVWHPIVDRTSSNDPWIYHGHDLIGRDRSALVAFHKQLMTFAQTPPKISWVFSPLRWTVAGGDLNERKAQRIVFEASVLDPLVLAARQQLITGPGLMRMDSSQQQIYHDESLEAMKSLFLIDNKILSRGLFTGDDAPDTGDADTNYIAPLLKFTASDENFYADDSYELAEVLSWTYSKGGGKGYWPPKELCPGNTLETNVDIGAGLERLMTFPLVVPSSTSSDDLNGEVVEDFAGFAKTVNDLNQNWSSHTELSHELKTRLDVLKPVINVLVNPNTLGPASCNVSLLGQQNSDLFHRWRFIAIVSTNLTGSPMPLSAPTGTAQDFLIGQVLVSQPIQISLRQYPQPGTKELPIVSFHDWGPIRLWFKYHYGSPDGNSCTVKLPVSGGGTVELKLDFEQPFPLNWPTKEQVLSGRSPES
jgi:hypothetical protein